MTKSSRLVGLLLSIFLVSCGIKVGAPAPIEFTAGIFYTNYVMTKVPWSIHVARVDRSNHELEFHSTHARGGALGLSTLSDQIRSVKATVGIPLAGVNGDFYVRDRAYAGDPRGLQIVEGELISAPIGGVSFWIDPAGLPHATNVVSRFKVTWPNGKTTPFGLNEERRADSSVVLYTPTLGRSTHTTSGTELVLEQEGQGPWLPLRIGTTCTARVREVRQTANTPLSSNVMVLSIGPALMAGLPALEAGAVLKIATETSPDLTGAKTAISGGPLLVHEGARQTWSRPAVSDPASYEIRSMAERHPRTAFGWDDQCFYLLEVDGRQKNLSVGMTLKEVADFMIGLGCKEVLNFDGGGSALIWCNGRIVNSPCDRPERHIANALILVRKPGGQGARVSRSE